MAQAKQPRRLRSYWITPEALALLLTAGEAWRVVEGMPADAKVVRTDYDIDRDLLVIKVEHESFDLVGAGETIPRAFACSIERINLTKEDV